MRFRRLAIAGSVVALALSTAATAAGAVSISVRPYALGVLGIGSTAPGDPASELCVIIADTPETYGGLVNGSPGGPAGDLNVSFFAQDLATQVATCVPTPISVDTVAVDNVATESTKPGHPGGTMQIATTSSVQPGILATAGTIIDVTYDSGVTIKTPGGAVLLSGSVDNPSGDTARFSLKPTVTKTKALLDTGACSDNQYFIDANTPDGTKFNAPKAIAIDDPAAPTLGDAGYYVATMRNCAEQNTSFPGKETKTKIKVTGVGNVSVDFVKATTANPQTWDTTRGKCKGVKVAGTFGDVTQSSRVIQCKGDYGEVIPFTLDVRTWATGVHDTYGVFHPGAPTNLLTHSFPLI
jgi:hypothetical protein